MMVVRAVKQCKPNLGLERECSYSYYCCLFPITRIASFTLNVYKNKPHTKIAQVALTIKQDDWAVSLQN